MNELFATFGINWKLLLIQAVNFGVLLGALTYLLYKPVLRILDERRAKIEEGVRAAEAASQRLADAKTEADGIVGDGARQAEGILASARTNAEEKGAQIVRDAEDKAHRALKDAEARIAEAERQAFVKSERDIAKAAMLAAEKILRESAATR
jgi:F-type H+-transporting ATPase subunit b